MRLTAEYRKIGPLVVAYLRGAILFGDEVDVIGRQVSAIAGDSRDVLLHLGGLKELRPGDLGTLWLKYVQAVASGWKIKLCDLTIEAQRLLYEAGIERAFVIYATEQEALAASNLPFSAFSHPGESSTATSL